MSSSVANHVELPLGYSIVDRLGAGGYGEVWKATAPGGLEKAVKIVFGHCDEGMAERELKSLERIKSVRHPFLLSIERFEIVNHRLVIVTELADRSLSDCFEAHVSEGRSGIPRDELIAYLWDAADALDCLLEQHSLQHLDIKPENLLVIGDHIKVADFGLVKELASKTLNSMMGGMTPLYSAPEIYDNNPSSRSDQYSLAIVYQQMLTGTLPFSGRTPAQLAKQHTLAEPNLFPLSDSDRAIVRRAMEKEPHARFSSCREFISALRSADQSRGAGVANAASNKVAYPYKQSESDDTKSIAIGDTDHLKDPVCVAATRILSNIKSAVQLPPAPPKEQFAAKAKLQFPRVDSTIEDVGFPQFDKSAPTVSVPTLFVGIGGVGIKMLRAIRSRANDDASTNRADLAWLAIDTERETLKGPPDGECQESLSPGDKLLISLRRPNQYREDSQALLQWVSRRWLYNIPRSLQTRGFRPLGRIAIVDHASAVLSALQERLGRLVNEGRVAGDVPRPVRVVLLVGMSGGTGGGVFIDVAQAVRSICGQFSQEVIVNGVLGSTYHPDGNDSLAAANMYSLLTELNHAQLHGNCGENTPPGVASHFELPRRPLDTVYTVPVPNRSDRMACHLSLQSIAEFLLLETDGDALPAITALRSTTSQEPEKVTLHTFSCVNIGRLSNALTNVQRQQLLKSVAEYWLKERSNKVDRDAKLFHPHENSQIAHAVLACFPDSPMSSADHTQEASSPAYDATIADMRARRTAKIKSIATAFLQFVESINSQCDDNRSAQESAGLSLGCDQIIANIAVMLQRNEIQENNLSQKLVEMVGSLLDELSKNQTAGDYTGLARNALSLFEASPLDCGFRRRSLLISPRDQTEQELSRAFLEVCPTLAACETTVDEVHLIREGDQLLPLHLGARLAELYPDIDDAAGRLHARDDIKWRDLRCE